MFSFSAYKARASVAPGPEAMNAFRDDLKQHKITKSFLQIPYYDFVPESLIRNIPECRIKITAEREDDRPC